MQNRITHFFPRKSAFRLQISVLTLTRFLEGDRAAVNQKASGLIRGISSTYVCIAGNHSRGGRCLCYSPRLVCILPRVRLSHSDAYMGYVVRFDGLLGRK